jgi:hypothetical protein
MKSNIEKVYSKLPKTELAKVELSAADDLQKIVNEFNSFLKKNQNSLKEIQNASKVIKEAKISNDEGYSLRSSAISTARKVMKQAKELGIDFTDIPVFKEYADVAAKLDDLNGKVAKELPR